MLKCKGKRKSPKAGRRKRTYVEDAKQKNGRGGSKKEIVTVLVALSEVLGLCDYRSR